MSRRTPAPQVDTRTEEEILARLREMAPHYTREWPARDEDDPGVGLLRIFSFIAGGVVGSLNRAPERNFLAFLDMLGVRLLPATPARAPVRFLVAQGTEDEFLVPAGTQVSAPAAEDRDEMPFITTEELTVTPAALVSLVAVDPARDRIYMPPPRFLELELAATEPPPMTVVAFSAARSKTLQLDLPEQLKKGDYLRIEPAQGSSAAGGSCCQTSPGEGQTGPNDYAVVAADPKGQIVTLTAPLARDYAEGTVVRKVTRFDIFEGGNFQEHVLYLAHAEFFDIKSEALIELAVEHAAGSPSNLQALDVAWEYFGAVEGQEGDGWQPFRVELDATGGFVRDGRVVLGKPPGEIKEAEVDGRKSRWIRASVTGPIPATPPRPLPKIERVALAVSSAAEGIPADQGFHNDTPLTVNLQFNPFGPEPRIFDRFYLASAEAFSKPGADVTLDINLDFTDLLAAPAAIFDAGRAQIRAFAHGAAGKLVEARIDPLTSREEFKPHGTPPETRIAAGSVPAVAVLQNRAVGVFVRADNGRIYLRYLPEGSATATWEDLKTEGLSGPAAHDPAAVFNNRMWHVFTVASNQVFTTAIHPLSPNLSVAWLPLPGSVAPTITSSPFAFTVRQSDPTLPHLVWVVATDRDGHTWLHNGAVWLDMTPTEPPLGGDPLPAFLAAENARPFAVAFNDENGDPQARIFLRNVDGELVAFDTVYLDNDADDEEVEQHRKHLGTPAGVTLAANPFVLARKDLDAGFAEEDFRVFVRGSDQILWERNLAQNVWEIDPDTGEPHPDTGVWTSHRNPSEFSLAGDPYVVSYEAGPDSKTDFVSVLSTSNKNTLVEFRIRGRDVAGGQPNELTAGPQEIIHLQTAPAPQDPSAPGPFTFFIQVTDGPGDDSDDDAVRRISAHEGTFALLASPLKDPATTDTVYRVFESKATGLVVAPEDEEEEEETGQAGEEPETPVANKVRLEEDSGAAAGNFIFVRGQLRSIENMEGDVATVSPPWTSQPEPGDFYHVLVAGAQNQKAQRQSNTLAVLDADDEGKTKALTGLFMEITSGPAANPVARQITGQLIAGIGVEVVVAEGFGGRPPRGGAGYRIFVGGLPEGWHVYSDPDQTTLRPELSWEYWNGTGWVYLRVEDGTKNFLVPGKIKFRLPQNIAQTEVAGQENFWIRARIVGGDYGREQFTVENGQLKISKDPIRPPLVKNLTITYAVTQFPPPQIVLTYNNLAYLDQTAANETADKHFQPFLTLPDERRALYFGFDREFEGGPIRLYFAAKELVVNERDRPKLAWHFTSDNELKPLSAEDDTEALTRPQFVKWVVPGRFQRRQYFGDALCWVRASLAEGRWDESPALAGVFLNTVETIQARVIRDETLGSSTGAVGERFRFAHRPVLEGEELRVREALTEDDRAQLLADEGAEVLFDILDKDGLVLETWVRWKEVQEFFDSGPRSRHYRLDRASGEVEFGDGVRGRIPQVGGDNIRAFVYRAGGGADGNVAAGEINTPVTAVAGVEGVINPVAAGGGSDEATAEEMLDIGPAQLSNRGRAVTPEDFERLARESSREVRKVRAFANRNATGRHEVGSVTLYIVPDSKEAAPVPSLELRRAVGRHLAARADFTVVSQGHIFVRAPRYVRVDVEVTVFAASFDVAGTAEHKVTDALEAFLHPLTGGPDGEGWDFGRDLAASDLYLLLESIEEVDHVDSLVLRRDGVEAGESVEVPGDALLAGGSHTVTTKVANTE